jgi:HlyD family secretion protein
MDRPIRQPWWRRKFWLQTGIAVGAAVLLITIAIMFLGRPERSVRVAATSVTVARVTEGTFHDFIPLTGKVVPMNTVYLDALDAAASIASSLKREIS